MKRYRVRQIDHTYTDPGPDLLRTAQNTVQRFARVMGSARTGWYIRVNPAGDEQGWTKWRGRMSRAEALQGANAALSRLPGAKFQAGRVKDGRPQPKAELFVVGVPEVDLPNVHNGAELVADLARKQFPGLTVAGFSCREYNNIPGSGWSDHAWGDAVDLWGPPNDKLTDWCVRMAREGCMGTVAQFIGSKSGRVYNFVAPSYAPNLGGPVSHLTHVHCSYVQHFGRDPNCR